MISRYSSPANGTHVTSWSFQNGALVCRPLRSMFDCQNSMQRLVASLACFSASSGGRRARQARYALFQKSSIFMTFALSAFDALYYHAKWRCQLLSQMVLISRGAVVARYQR